jgi:hypothetical protein
MGQAYAEQDPCGEGLGERGTASRSYGKKLQHKLSVRRN